MNNITIIQKQLEKLNQAYSSITATDKLEETDNTPFLDLFITEQGKDYAEEIEWLAQFCLVGLFRSFFN